MSNIILGVFGITSILFLYVGISRLVKIGHSQRTIAQVVDEEFHTDTDAEGYTTTSRFPIYEYEFNGETRRTRSTTSGGKKIGEEAEIYLTDKGEVLELRTSYWFIGIGIVMGAIALSFYLRIFR